ncbi:MAG: CHRD domain-containing protein [Thermoleophilaceae bacterium]
MRGRRVQLAALVAVAAVGGVAVTTAVAGGGDRNLRTELIGYEEVPAVSTGGDGKFKARVSRDDEEIRYELRYEDLSSPVQQAHIHFGQFAVNGGISVFLCSNLDDPSAGTQACPPAPAKITGEIDEDDVIAPTGQGIAARELDELLRAIRAGVAYVNVHTDMFPGGEIRGQLDRDRHGDDDD